MASWSGGPEPASIVWTVVADRSQQMSTRSRSSCRGRRPRPGLPRHPTLPLVDGRGGRPTGVNESASGDIPVPPFGGQPRPELGRVIVPEDELQGRVAALGKEITADYADRPPLLVGVLK